MTAAPDEADVQTVLDLYFTGRLELDHVRQFARDGSLAASEALKMIDRRNDRKDTLP